MTVVLVITPGSTTAVVVRNTLVDGHGAGLRAALGAAVANATHATLAGLGLWVVVGRWPAVHDAIRMGGAAFLAWLGARSLARAWPGRAPGAMPFAAGHPAPVTHTGFREGLGVNLLNPAIISFYLAVVPTFTPATAPRGFFALLAATHVLLALACHATWATAFHKLRAAYTRPRIRRLVDLVTGAALVWLALRVLGWPA